MEFPIKTCVICSEEFDLRPGKPGFANRCPECSAADEAAESAGSTHGAFVAPKTERELNEARRRAMREMLYRKES